MIYACHPALHDIANWEKTSPLPHYTFGAKHVTGVRVAENSSREEMGKHIVYSGKTLERVKTMFNIEAFAILKHHIDNGDNIARLDLALDFINSGLTVDDFQYQFEREQAKTRLRKVTTVQNIDGAGHTLYVGSRKKRKKLVRIYDKAAEQHLQGDWIRVEVQLMSASATHAAQLIVEADFPLSLILNIIRGVIDFPSLETWNQAFEGSTDVKLASDPQTAGMRNHWIKTQVIPAIASEIIIDASFWVQFTMLVEKALLKKGRTIDDIPF